MMEQKNKDQSKVLLLKISTTNTHLCIQHGHDKKNAQMKWCIISKLSSQYRNHVNDSRLNYHHDLVIYKQGVWVYMDDVILKSLTYIFIWMMLCAKL